MTDKMINSAVIAAGGVGKRMGHKQAKQFIEVDNKPLICYTLDVFQQSKDVDYIVLVVGLDEVERVKKEIVETFSYTKVVSVVPGGRERRDSVYEGLLALPEDTTHVMVHDGARPLIQQKEISKSLEAVKIYRACVLGAKVKDTIKITDEKGYVVSTPIRSLTYQIQTPQTFEKELLLDAYKKSYQEDFPVTDDAMIVERYTDTPVKVIEGSYRNIKITTPEDLALMHYYVQGQ